MHSKIYSKIKEFIIKEKYFIILNIVLFLVAITPLPYYIYSSGGILPVGPKINVATDKKESGSFNLTYVRETTGTVFSVLMSYLIPNWDLIEESELRYNNLSIEESIYQDKMLYEEAFQNAIILSYKKAGKDIAITDTHQYVLDMIKETNTDLKVGDEIIKVQGQTPKNINEYRSIVDKLKVGDKIILEVIDKEGNPKTKYAEVIDYKGKKITGVYLMYKYNYRANPEIKIEEKTSEYGPSGGLMLSLFIYNKLINEDLTKGLTIAGTGTIDIKGNVGEIGGLKYKMLGAMKSNVDIFFVPNENNYDEALQLKKEFNFKYKIVGVSTFNDAINYLKQL